MLIPGKKVEIISPPKIPRDYLPYIIPPDTIAQTSSPIIQHSPKTHKKANVEPPDYNPTTKVIAKTRSNTLRISKRTKRRNYKYPVMQYLIEKYSVINSHEANPVIDPNTGASL